MNLIRRILQLVGVASAVAAIYACAPERAASSNAGLIESSVSAKPVRLRELSWLHPDANATLILSTTPESCLRDAEDREAAYLVGVGRAAFNNPMLFGGPAARGGLSCASCHRGGHDNPAFFLTGLSGVPGTADVTSALFSKTREDGVFDPVPIPSLVGVARKNEFGTQAPTSTLHDFIESAVVEEFQGAPPPEMVVKGLMAYIEHLDAAACAGGAVMRTVSADMAAVYDSVSLAIGVSRGGDQATADFLILSAQNTLGGVHERYAAQELKQQRIEIRRLSRSLGDARLLLGRSAKLETRLNSVLVELVSLEADLEHYRRHSLYDVDRLRAALLAAKWPVGPK